MTLREWAKTYGGTYSTLLFLAAAVSTVVTNEYAGHSLWLHLLIGLPLLLVLQLGFSALAWQFTERRRRKAPGQSPDRET